MSNNHEQRLSGACGSGYAALLALISLIGGSCCQSSFHAKVAETKNAPEP